MSLTGTARAATPPVESLTIVGTSAVGTYDIGAATFGTSLYDVSGPIVLADGDGCGPLTPVPAGSIMFVDRGTCAFPLKAANAQAAGAAALVIVDSLLSAIPFIPVGVAAGVTIPVAGFTKDDADAIKAAIAANESPTAQLLRRQPLLTVTALDGNFADQAVGTIGPALRFRVENTGTADGVIGNAYAGTTTGAGSNGALTGADFLLGANYCAESTLTPGGGCTLYVRFVPGTPR